jgi:hypothetical protein
VAKPKVFSFRVRVEMTREQIEAYCEEYGLDPASIRDDLASHIANGLQSSTALNVEDGCSISITVT